jgi:hypothetical protein
MFSSVFNSVVNGVRNSFNNVKNDVRNGINGTIGKVIGATRDLAKTTRDFLIYAHMTTNIEEKASKQFSNLMKDIFL